MKAGLRGTCFWACCGALWWEGTTKTDFPLCATARHTGKVCGREDWQSFLLWLRDWTEICFHKRTEAFEMYCLSARHCNLRNVVAKTRLARDCSELAGAEGARFGHSHPWLQLSSTCQWHGSPNPTPNYSIDSRSICSRGYQTLPSENSACTKRAPPNLQLLSFWISYPTKMASPLTQWLELINPGFTVPRWCCVGPSASLLHLVTFIISLWSYCIRLPTGLATSGLSSSSIPPLTWHPDPSYLSKLPPVSLFHSSKCHWELD